MIQTHEECFRKEADHWSFSITVAYSSRTYLCNDTYLLGGHLWSKQAQKHEYFKRTYLNLPEHITIRFTMKFWAIDRWEHNPTSIQQDYVQLEFDSHPVIDLFGLNSNDYSSLPSICGVDDKSEVKDILVFGSIPHSNDSLILKIISQLNAKSKDESFGVREIKLIFSTTSTVAPLCAIIPVQSYRIQNCTCPKRFYDFGIICKECHPSCDSCFGPSETDCYECNEGYYFDGAGCTGCHSLCSRCSGPNYNQCLDCFAGFILFEDECIASDRCTIPFTMATCSNSCISSCAHLDKALWDETCYPPCLGNTISGFKGFCHGKFCFV